MSNEEKVARAAFPFVVMPPRGWTDGERQAYEDGGRWTEGQEAARKVRSTDLAAAAIDALADVDGIGAVLAAHSLRDGSSFDGYLITCDCNDNTAYTRGTHARHLAAAVVAWMKDRA